VLSGLSQTLLAAGITHAHMNGMLGASRASR
jgi:hypothetical protein